MSVFRSFAKLVQQLRLDILCDEAVDRHHSNPRVSKHVLLALAALDSGQQHLELAAIEDTVVEPERLDTGSAPVVGTLPPRADAELMRWVRTNRPDALSHFEATLDAVYGRKIDTERADALILLIASSFDAGRWYQRANSAEVPIGHDPYGSCVRCGAPVPLGALDRVCDECLDPEHMRTLRARQAEQERRGQ